MANPAPSHPQAPRAVTPVVYAPSQGYRLDTEVYPFSELRRRAGDVEKRGFERTDFHCLLYVTAGRYAHLVDFELHECGRGAFIVVQPGQVHHFGDLSRCDGWTLIFRSEVLPARGATATGANDIAALTRLEALPAKVVLPPGAQLAATETIQRMAMDAGRPASRSLNALLRSQVEALVMRLHIDGVVAEEPPVEPVQSQRFRRYRSLIERELATWHCVARYAAALGCSEKSLSRAALAVADRSAKQVLSDRIVLEAKRLLAHSWLPVATIGYELGFDEPTNFVKFFRRETRLTPGLFRAKMNGGAQGSQARHRVGPADPAQPGT